MSLLSSLTDYSNAAWTDLETGSSTVNVTGVGTNSVVTASLAQADDQRAFRLTVAAYDFRGDSFFTRLTQVANDASGRRYTGIFIYIDANNWVGFGPNGATGVWYRLEAVAGVVASNTFSPGSIAYNATTQAWVRIRGSADGATLYFDVAADLAGAPDTWTQIQAWTIPIAMTAVKGAVGVMGFYNAVETQPGLITKANGGADPTIPPTADFDIVSVDLKTVEVVSAAVAGTNPITSTLYDYGDGSAPTSSVTHTYDDPGGEFDITQTVSDGTLSDTSDPQTINTQSEIAYQLRTNPGGRLSNVATVLVNDP